MTSIRLNKSIRADILNNIRAAYLNENKRPTPIEGTTESLSEAIIAVFKQKHKAVYAEYNASKFKDVWNTMTSFRFINAQGSYCRVDNPYDHDKREYKHTLLAAESSSGVFIDLSNPDTKVPAPIRAILTKAKTIRAKQKVRNTEISDFDLEMQRYLNDVEQVIAGVNTTKQLLEVWAEVEKFLPKGLTNPSAITLPSVNINALNRKLGTAK